MDAIDTIQARQILLGNMRKKYHQGTVSFDFDEGYWEGVWDLYECLSQDKMPTSELK
jgi:hypothetical protein